MYPGLRPTVEDGRNNSPTRRVLTLLSPLALTLPSTQGSSEPTIAAVADARYSPLVWFL